MKCFKIVISVICLLFVNLVHSYFVNEILVIPFWRFVTFDNSNLYILLVYLSVFFAQLFLVLTFFWREHHKIFMFEVIPKPRQFVLSFLLKALQRNYISDCVSRWIFLILNLNITSIHLLTSAEKLHNVWNVDHIFWDFNALSNRLEASTITSSRFLFSLFSFRGGALFFNSHQEFINIKFVQPDI